MTRAGTCINSTLVSAAATYSHFRESICYVLGGNLKSDRTAVHLVSLNENHGIEISLSSRIIWKDLDVTSMELVYHNPWPELAFNPCSLLCTTNDSKLWGYKLEGTRYHYPTPISFFGICLVLQKILFCISGALFLTSTGSIKFKNHPRSSSKILLYK